MFRLERLSQVHIFTLDSSSLEGGLNSYENRWDTHRRGNSEGFDASEQVVSKKYDVTDRFYRKGGGLNLFACLLQTAQVLLAIMSVVIEIGFGRLA